MALAGEANQAETLMAELAKGRPKDVIVQFVRVPEIKAINEINRGNPAKALELLQAATPYEGYVWGIEARSTRGNAYLKAGRGKEAAQEFQKLLDNVSIRLIGSGIGAILCSTAQLGLARAYALQGDKAKSRVAYQDFFALWKDADSDIPILRAAKAEYAKLK